MYVSKRANTLNLLCNGYLYIKNNIKKHQSNLYETHLMGQKTICISGSEAAKIFYNTELFQRNGAAPKRIQKTLTGVGALHTLDGEAHRHRKLALMSLMTPIYQQQLAKIVRERCEIYISKWELADEMILFDETKDILCQAACQWAGIPLPEAELKDWADSLSEMVDAFGAVGPRHWRGRVARCLVEAWITEVIEDVRANKLKAEEGTPLHTMAFHKDPEGNLLNPEMAAIELINIIRPIVAISIYITFAATALYEHPESKEKLKTGDSHELDLFALEVRRYYPLAPFLGAKVKKDFTWNHYQFKSGTLVLLDVYGTNHDSQQWDNPDTFNSQRFKDWQGDPFNFIPQGGGDPNKGHRCPGEGITVEIMKTFIDFLINKIDYQIPTQDLSYSLSKMPTLPKSGFIMTNIKRKS